MAVIGSKISQVVNTKNEDDLLNELISARKPGFDTERIQHAIIENQ